MQGGIKVRWLCGQYHDYDHLQVEVNKPLPENMVARNVGGVEDTLLLLNLLKEKTIEENTKAKVCLLVISLSLSTMVSYSSTFLSVTRTMLTIHLFFRKRTFIKWPWRWKGENKDIQTRTINQCGYDVWLLLFTGTVVMVINIKSKHRNYSIFNF